MSRPKLGESVTGIWQARGLTLAARQAELLQLTLQQEKAELKFKMAERECKIQADEVHTRILARPHSKDELDA